jgi:hypothetical protein
MRNYFFPVLDGVDFPTSSLKFFDNLRTVISYEPGAVSHGHALSGTIASSTLKMNLSLVPREPIITSSKRNRDEVSGLSVLTDEVFRWTGVAVCFFSPDISFDSFPCAAFRAGISHLKYCLIPKTASVRICSQMKFSL